MNPRLLSELVANNLASALWFWPEMALTLGTMAVLVLDLAVRRREGRPRMLAGATLLVLAVSAILLTGQSAQATSLFNGMIASDSFANFFKWIFLAAAAKLRWRATAMNEFRALRGVKATVKVFYAYRGSSGATSFTQFSALSARG